MCGISGIFSVKATASLNLVQEMTDLLKHRGPDAGGYYQSEDGHCVLGHRRLSIIDLRDAANQPMPSSCGRYMIVFNGEVYNFKELKEDILKFKDVNFKTTSDTEVLIEAFALWGKAFIYKLNGMFSIAIYDKQDKILWLFRDRLGIKPLFYFWNGEFFAFSSELKSLLALRQKLGAFHLNKEAVNQYLRLGYIPEPNTIYKEVQKFGAAHLGAVSPYGFSSESYWNLDKKINKFTYNDEEKSKVRLNELIESSVKYRLISDVPFGTFLSGGIDSSLVTAVAQHVSPTPINTFSIGFKEAKYNEAEHAAKIANQLKTNHHEFIVSYQDAVEHFDQIIEAYDEPYADSSAIPTMLVSKLAKQYVTMTLSGDGGDEQFMGYGAYTWAKRLNNPFINAMKGPAKFFLSKSKQSKYKRVAEMFNYDASTHMPSHIFSVEQYFFSARELNDLLLKGMQQELKYPLVERERKLNAVENQAFFDLKHYLKDDLLVKVDRASMQYSLETRVPLLDHRIVEFSINLNDKLKLKNKESKYLLKQVLYEYLPKELFDRPKWGFSIPIRYWLQNELKYLIDNYLSDTVLLKYRIFDKDKVKDLVSRYFAGEDHLFNKIWAIILLNQWLEKNEDLTIY
ncbi:MAG: asparagine synthase (glutamine-hydrolyzing) [Chitinophagales bacterium]|nr:asparagine synthase (glutamine-hydrolyzing) [Chitinophagales bacterium]